MGKWVIRRNSSYFDFSMGINKTMPHTRARFFAIGLGYTTGV